MMRKNPKIKKIYIECKRGCGWKFGNKKGLLKFKQKVPVGTKAEIYYKKRRKRGRFDDGARTKQVVLPEQTD